MPRPVSTYALWPQGDACVAPTNGLSIDPTFSLRRGLKAQADPKHLGRIEIKLRIEAALDRSRLAEAVLLAGKKEIGDRIALAPERLDQDFRLVGRHDRILLA